MLHRFFRSAHGLAAACLLATTPLTAETVFESTGPESWNNIKKITAVADQEQSVTLRVALPVNVNQVVSSVRIPIDPKTTYTLSGEFRLSEPGKARPFYFGFRPLDKRGRTITAVMVNAVAGARITELAADAKKGDQMLILKDASSWKIDKAHYLVAFGAREDGSDLPNRTLSNYLAQEEIQKRADGTYELRLNQPLGSDQAAGTAVRLHASGGTYPYTAAAGRELTGEWQTFSGTIGGIRQQGLSSTQWRPGTVQADVFFFCRAENDAHIQFRNLKVENN